VSELIESTLRLFNGRTEVYARAFPKKDSVNGKVGYVLVKDGLTAEAVRGHLAGEQLLGRYQLLPDSTVWWFALDFDTDSDGTDVLDQASKQLDAFESAGLQCYLEQSRSGRGLHIWGFFDQPVPAVDVRRALRPLLLDAESFDRMYPVQTTVSETKPYGNLIALPFFGAQAPAGWASALGPGVPGGASVFLHRDTFEPLDPEDFCAQVYLNTREMINVLVRAIPPEAKQPTETRLYDEAPREVVEWGETEPRGRPANPQRGVLKLISDFGCSFMAHAFTEQHRLKEPEWYAAIQQLTCFQHGREAAHLVSQGHPSYSPKETDDKFTQALRHSPVGCAYIREHFPSKACKACPSGAPYHRGNPDLLSLVQDTNEPMIHSNYAGSLDRMRRRNRGEVPTGATWGIAGLDRYTRLRPKELTVVGSLPSIGKTSLMVDAAVSLAERGVPVLLFSAETGQEGFEERLLARMSGVDSRAIRGERMWAGHPMPLTPEEDAEVTAAAARLTGLPIYTHYSAAQPDLIMNLLEDTILRERLALAQPMVVFMDYLQFATSTGVEGASDYDRLTRLSAEFKYMAKVLRQSVVLFSQVSRNKEANDEPAINWFKGTGRIEADADVALILTGERTPGAVSQRKLTIVKQREGEAGVAIDLLLHQAVSRFEVAPDAMQRAVPSDLFAGETHPLTDF
jgi:hypothetical protein